MIDIAYKNSHRLMKLINDILDLEKIEAGKLDIHARSVAITPLVDQAVAANWVYAEQAGIRYVVEEHVQNALVWADADRLMQVLINLLSNAARFSPSNSDVAVSVLRHDHYVRLAISHDFAPDLVLLDVMMPGMDGPSTLRALRRMPATAHVPVIFMTAKALRAETEEYRRLGALDVIPKPFDPMSLPATIRRIWDRNLTCQQPLSGKGPRETFL